jgi:hypothetical protein
MRNTLPPLASNDLFGVASGTIAKAPTHLESVPITKFVLAVPGEVYASGVIAATVDGLRFTVVFVPSREPFLLLEFPTVTYKLGVVVRTNLVVSQVRLIVGPQ